MNHTITVGTIRKLLDLSTLASRRDNAVDASFIYNLINDDIKSLYLLSLIQFKVFYSSPPISQTTITLIYLIPPLCRAMSLYNKCPDLDQFSNLPNNIIKCYNTFY